MGVTTNPTIFAAAITGSDAYTAQIRDLAARDAGVTEALRELTATDVRDACDVLRPVYDATGGVDGRVSIEVDPRLADDTEATITQARVLWRLVGRPNLYIKIPATRRSIPAVTACLAEGISVNVTLIFSLARYDEVLEAFLDGLLAAHRAATRSAGSGRWLPSSSAVSTPRSTVGWIRSALARPLRFAAPRGSRTLGSPMPTMSG